MKQNEKFLCCGEIITLSLKLLGVRGMDDSFMLLGRGKPHRVLPIACTRSELTAWQCGQHTCRCRLSLNVLHKAQLAFGSTHLLLAINVANQEKLRGTLRFFNTLLKIRLKRVMYFSSLLFLTVTAEEKLRSFLPLFDYSKDTRNNKQDVHGGGHPRTRRVLGL